MKPILTVKSGILRMIFISLFIIILLFSLALIVDRYRVCPFDLFCIGLWRNLLMSAVVFTPLIMFLVVLVNHRIPFNKIDFDKRKKFMLGEKRVKIYEI